MTWQAVSSAVLDFVIGVEGITGGAGTVVDYEPDISEESVLTGYLKDIAEGKRRLNFWIVERTGLTSVRGGRAAEIPIGWGQYEDNYTVRGFYNYTGRDSYFGFQTLVDRVMEALLTNISLGTAVANLHTTAPRASRIGYAEFARVYCHTVEITFTANRPGSISYA